MSMECNFCGSQRFKKVTVKNGYPILKCRVCALIQADVADNVEDIYNSPDYFASQSTGVTFGTTFLQRREELSTIPLNERTFDLFNAFPKEIHKDDFQNKSVLEIGPSPGGGTMRYLTALAVVEGLEISKKAADHLRDIGFTMYHGRIGEIKIDKMYDIIFAYEVVEHFRDPKKAIEAIYGLLKPGGKFIISTGNVKSLKARVLRRRWTFYLTPQHLYYFGDSTITKYLEHAGFKRDNIEIYKFSLWSKKKAIEMGFPNMKSRLFLRLISNLTSGMTVYAAK
jgi:SAM-dependent methyltransferase